MTALRPRPPAPASFTAGDVALLIVVLVLLVASAVLALAETSLVRMSRTKAMALVEDGRRGAPGLVRLTEHPQGFLNPVLLLVLICQLVVATLVGILADQLVRGLGRGGGHRFEIVIIFVLGEAVPKNWAVHHPERAALFERPPWSPPWSASRPSASSPGRSSDWPTAHRPARASTGRPVRDRVRAVGHGRRGPRGETSSRPRSAPSSTRSSSSVTPWCAR